jgi:putative aldouronate transport system substrate-binding protein
LYRSDLPYGWGTVITKSCANPEAAMKLIDYMCGTEEGFLLTTYGVKGKQWEWSNKKKGIIKLPDGISDADNIQSAGGETHFTTGWLVKFAQKFNMNSVDGPFMQWLNNKRKVNTYYPVDFDVPYDVSVMKSKDNINSLDTLFSEESWKIIMGQEPVSYWDEVVKKWMANGGSQWIEDYTAQYNAAKK